MVKRTSSCSRYFVADAMAAGTSSALLVVGCGTQCGSGLCMFRLIALHGCRQDNS